MPLTPRPLTLVGLAALTLGCAETIEIPNVPAQITAHGVCQPAGSDRWYLRLGLQDAEEHDLHLRLTTPAGETLLPGPTGSGLRGLSSLRPPQALIHLFEWHSDPTDASPCDALPADLPGPSGPCVAVPPGGPADPLNLIAYVDDGAEISQTPLQFTRIAAEDCEPAR